MARARGTESGSDSAESGERRTEGLGRVGDPLSDLTPTTCRGPAQLVQLCLWVIVMGRARPSREAIAPPA